MWSDIKQAVLDATGLSPNLMHVLLGLLIFAAVFLIVRRGAPAFVTVVAF